MILLFSHILYISTNINVIQEPKLRIMSHLMIIKRRKLASSSSDDIQEEMSPVLSSNVIELGQCISKLS